MGNTLDGPPEWNGQRSEFAFSWSVFVWAAFVFCGMLWSFSMSVRGCGRVVMCAHLRLVLLW